MRVTVTAMCDEEKEFAKDWADLAGHCQVHKPDLVLLPELPFSSWIASSPEVSVCEKTVSCEKHTRWLDRLPELAARFVVYSRPVFEKQQYFNTAFIYAQNKGHMCLHTKGLFPEEPHFYERSCYDTPEPKYRCFDAGPFKIGVLLCTEMWFTDRARGYGKEGVDLLLCPRATGISALGQWTRLGQTLSVISGGFCLSSNKAGFDQRRSFQWGGGGWVTAPGNGDLLGWTGERGFSTVDLDLERARNAKKDYPLYVKEYEP